MRFLRKLLLWALALVVVVVGGAIAAFFFTPSATLAGFAADRVREATGRELVIEGEIERTLYPVLGVRTGPVRLSNADWAESDHLLAADALAIGVDAAALMGGQTRIKTFELVQPEINLEVSATGQESWAIELEDEAALDEAGGGGGEAADGDIAIVIENASITNGAINYVDRFSGQTLSMRETNLMVSLPAIDQTLSLDGSAVVNGRRATLSGALDSPATFNRGETTLARLELTADGLSGMFTGEFRPPRGGALPEANGELAVNLSGDRDLTAWLRQALPPNLEDLGAVDVAGSLDVGGAGLNVDLTGDAELKGVDTALRVAAQAGPGWAEGGETATIDVSARNTLFALAYAGDLGLTPNGEPTARGTYEIKADDVPAVFAWIGVSFPAGDPASRIDSVDLAGDVALDDSRAEFASNGAVGFGGRAVSVDVDITGEDGWMRSGAMSSDVKFASEGLFDASWNGVTTPSTAFAADGRATLSSPDFERFASWAAGEAIGAPEGALGAVNFATDLDLDADAMRLTNLTLDIGETSATGSIAVDMTSGDRPNVVAEVTTNGAPLDLRPFSQIGGGGGGSNGAGAGGGSDGPRGGGWSQEPFDLAVFQLIDATFSVALNSGLISDTITLDATRVSGELRGGDLTANVHELNLYGGAMRDGLIEIATSNQPRYRVTGALSGVQLRPFLSQVAGVGSIDGAGAFTLDINGPAQSMFTVMRGMNGSASIDFRSGAILGVDLAAAARNIPGFGGSGGGSQTVFSVLSASFVINEGLAQNNDLLFDGPEIGFTGAGVVDLGAQTLNYRIRPTKLLSFGQGLPALEVVVSGPWSNPSIQPDLGSVVGEITNLLRDPSGAIRVVEGLLEGGPVGAAGEAVEGLIEGVTGGGEGGNPVEGLIDGLTGGGGDDGGGDDSPNPGRLLRGLF